MTLLKIALGFLIGFGLALGLYKVNTVHAVQPKSPPETWNVELGCVAANSCGAQGCNGTVYVAKEQTLENDGTWKQGATLLCWELRDKTKQKEEQ